METIHERVFVMGFDRTSHLFLVSELYYHIYCTFEYDIRVIVWLEYCVVAKYLSYSLNFWTVLTLEMPECIINSIKSH